MPSREKQPVAFLQSAVINITTEFMNPKCNFPAVLRRSHKVEKICMGVCERDGYHTQRYHYRKLSTPTTVTHTHTYVRTQNQLSLQLREEMAQICSEKQRVLFLGK